MKRGRSIQAGRKDLVVQAPPGDLVDLVVQESQGAPGFLADSPQQVLKSTHNESSWPFTTTGWVLKPPRYKLTLTKSNPSLYSLSSSSYTGFPGQWITLESHVLPEGKTFNQLRKLENKIYSLPSSLDIEGEGIQHSQSCFLWGASVSQWEANVWVHACACTHTHTHSHRLTLNLISCTGSWPQIIEIN